MAHTPNYCKHNHPTLKKKKKRSKFYAYLLKSAKSNETINGNAKKMP